jgi:hypothetical protein
MNDNLRAVLPTTSPYGDGATVTASVFTVTGSGAIVDWVQVELRSNADINTVITSKAALLQADGDVVGLDGVTPFAVTGLVGTYYVSVNHRNHIVVATNTAEILNGSSRATIDFTVGTTARGGAGRMSLLETGVYGLVAGDADGNEQIQVADSNAELVVLGQGGYLNTDSSLNGQVQISDINLFVLPSLGVGKQF